MWEYKAVMHNIMITISKAKGPRCRKNASRWGIYKYYIHSFYWKSVISDEINWKETD
jgi:hypothetical protein